MDNENTHLTKEKKKHYDGKTNNMEEKPNQRRIPIVFSSNNLLDANSINNAESDDPDVVMSMNRYRYYSRLGMPTMPDHVVPSRFFILVPLIGGAPGTQKSYITIFAIWNTMMGTSFLSMPWVFTQSGFLLGIFLMLFVASIAFYTVYLVLKASEKMKESPSWTMLHPDFTDACKHYLGKPGEILAIVFSFIGLLGALIVYYVLLTNFLYSSVTYIYNYATNHESQGNSVILYNRTLNDVICPVSPSYPTHNASFTYLMYPGYKSYGGPNNSFMYSFQTPSMSNQSNYNSSDYFFYKLWKPSGTVPFWLLLLIVPLVSIRSPDFFTKFNALGTVSIVYLLSLLFLKLFKWGVHLDFSQTEYPYVIPLAKATFPVLTGVGMLAFFIHNAVHSIIRNQEKPENNIRDVFIAYICVAITYMTAGIVFYVAFPFDKDCIQQNFLANLTNHDLFAFIARAALFLQMMTVFPLLMYILRSQFMYFFYKKMYPSWLHVSMLHFILLLICVCFAVFMPQIGEIIRFSGALCGLVYMITLPCLVKIQMIRQASPYHRSISYTNIDGNKVRKMSLITKDNLKIGFHIFLIFLAIINFIGQFTPFFIST